MVDFPIDTGIVKIGASIFDETKTASQEWFGSDIIIKIPGSNLLTTIVADFAYDTTSVVEYTLNSGGDWIAFNQGNAVAGGQSRFIRVRNGDELNFRALTAGTVVRCIVSVP